MSRSRFSGNALMEYALPATVILITAGLLATVVDIQGLIGQYFMASSGHTSSDLDGTTFKPGQLASGQKGSAVGSGRADRFDNFGLMLDGSGSPLPGGAIGSTYNGPVDRSGPRVSAAGSRGGEDFIYGTGRRGGGGGGGDIPVPDNSSNELQARVMDTGDSIRALGLAQASGDPQQIAYQQANVAAQQAGYAAYAGRHMDEVLRMDPGDYREALDRASAAIRSGNPPDYGFFPGLGGILQQLAAEENLNTNGPTEIACAQDGDSCDSPGIQISEAQEMMLMRSQDRDATYQSIVERSIASMGGTPTDPAVASAWLSTQTSDNVDDLNAEYDR